MNTTFLNMTIPVKRKAWLGRVLITQICDIDAHTCPQSFSSPSSTLTFLPNLSLQDLGAVTVLPLATGMAMTMTLLTLRQSRPPGARYVIWSRIDQKTCIKVGRASSAPACVCVQLHQHMPRQAYCRLCHCNFHAFVLPAH